VITISLEEDKRMGEMLGLAVPLPWLKSCGVYVQGAKADETRDNLSCSVYECLRG
jgi:hypothetical protein